MSKEEKRSRGKRPRYEATPSREAPQAQGFTPIKPQSQSNPTFADHQEQYRQAQGTNFEGQARNPDQAQRRLAITTQAPPGKVAIPALKTPQAADSSKNFKKGRTSHACDYCRKAKAGCTGEQPCSRCRNAGVDCVYGDGKRMRDRKQMSKLTQESDNLTQHNAEVTEALRRISQDTRLTSEDMRAAIDEVLAMTLNPVSPNEKEEVPSVFKRASTDVDEEGGSEEDSDDAEVGSTGSVDVVNVNTDLDDTRETGHIGKSSSVAWAKRTAEECNQSTEGPTTLGRHDTGFTQASYHTEDADLEPFDDSNVHPHDWPDRKLADNMIQSYFDHIHNTLPIIDKAGFMSKYAELISRPDQLPLEDSVWLAKINIVFAISSVYFDLTKSPNRVSYQDHLVYCARAKKLFLDQGLLYQDARILTTSALGLLSLYFLITCRLNRAWTFCGLAIRHALTLGLHVRSEAQDLSDVEKEHRVRLWWSLYSLECILNELTGRPSCISDRDISTPLPLNKDEDDFHPWQTLYNKTEKGSRNSSRRDSRSLKTSRPSATYQMPTGVSQPLAYTFPVYPLPATPSTYFIYRTQLSIISHEIVTQLYCAATVKERWRDVQDTIHRIDQRLLAWRDKLATDFDITFEDTWIAPDWSDPNIIERMGLAMQFSSSRMILFRPCLCRFEGRLKQQSDVSKDFNQEAVENCIRSARKMISLLSWSASNVQKLYAVAPWWNTLHYICEALSVLMLEMAFQATHLPNEAAYILEDAKKGINWLAMMAERSISARKAWEIFDYLIRLVAPLIRWSVFDLPTQAPVPPGYNWRRFNNVVSPPSPIQHSLPPITQHQTQPHNLPAPSSQQHHPPTQIAQSPFPHYQALSSQQSILWQPAPAFNFPYSQPEYEQVANPLDHSTAISRFSQMGQVHGHYDDPWQHFFFPDSAPPSNLPPSNLDFNVNGAEGDVMQGQMGPGADRERYEGVYGCSSGEPSPGFAGFMDAERETGMGGGFDGPADGNGGGEGSSGGSGSTQGRRGYF